MRSSSSESGNTNEELECHVRPGGMVVQRRDASDDDQGPLIKLKVSHGSSLFDLSVPSRSSFGYLKEILAQQTGLDPKDQKLCFRGREKDDDETLQAAGVKDLSKLLLLEQPESKERRIEEMKKREETLKACEAVAEVRAEVDKLYQKVAALEASVRSGTKVEEREFIVLTELLMRQLLKLDCIEAEGEAKLKRKTEGHKLRPSAVSFWKFKTSLFGESFDCVTGLKAVRRVQGYVDALDAMKARNSNPSASYSNSVSVSTQWETFDSGVGSLTPPSATSANATQDWERSN